MKTIDQKATTSTPAISFDPDTNVLRISGESYPENSFDFYAPVLSWLKVSLLELPELTLDISVTYMNSSSTKCTLDIMDVMEEAYLRGVRTKIIWHYDRDNPRSYEMAEEFREEVAFPFGIEVLDS
jgi:SiaC family regulatory phosphoprotein